MKTGFARIEGDGFCIPNNGFVELSEDEKIVFANFEIGVGIPWIDFEGLLIPRQSLVESAKPE